MNTTVLSPSKPKRLHIKTYGCQMNVYDTQAMIDILQPLGYEATDEVEGADLVLLNTCHIREKAVEKVYSEIGRLKDLRETKAAQGDGHMSIVIAGCVAQAQGEEIMRRAPSVDFVIGPQSYHQLPELIARTARQKGERLVTNFEPQAKFDRLGAQHIGSQRNLDAPTAFLTIQEGCDKFCTFCVVPYTRGAEWSRPVAAIIQEARSLVDRGAVEITLLGQNVNAYNGEDAKGKASNLARLFEALSEIEGLKRLRYMTSHPNDMSPDLIKAHAQLPKLMPFFHLPVQSGSNKILRAMNRKHTREQYFEIIDQVRSARSDIAVSGDFIVGFPGETDADFDDTLDLIRRVDYATAFSFIYSPRPGTSAAVMPKQIFQELAHERLSALQALLSEQQNKFKSRLIGQTIEVLFEKKGREDGQAIGRSPYMQSVFVEGAQSLIGQIAPVRIEALGNNSLKGILQERSKT